MSSLSVLNEIENISMSGMVIEEPNLLRLGSGAQSKFYSLNWYAKSTIYKGIDLKPKLSSDLFNLDSSIWSSVIKSKYEDSEFDFDEQKAIVFRGKIIEIIENNAYDTSTFETFLAKIRTAASKDDSYFNSFGSLVIPFKKDKSIMIMTLNFDGGWYALHSGVIADEKYIIFPKADIESSSLAAFMYQFNNSFDDFAQNAYVISTQNFESLGFDFNENLSLREMYDIIFKDLKCATELDEEGYISSIPGISTENSEILVNFFNSFGLTFKSLKKLSFLRKTFRSGSITADTLLRIISKESKSEAINAHGYTFANICKLCDTEEFDKKIIEEELKK